LRNVFDDAEQRIEVCLPVPPEEPAPVAMDGGVADVGAGQLPDMAIPEGPSVSLARTVPIGRGNTWVRAQGIKDGIVVIVSEVRPGPSATLGLNRVCRQVSCAVGQTCIDGECALVPAGGQCD
jgi:hypothetical protein